MIADAWWTEFAWPAESWLRFPPGDVATFTADKDAIVWVKTGHLTGEM